MTTTASIEIESPIGNFSAELTKQGASDNDGAEVEGERMLACLSGATGMMLAAYGIALQDFIEALRTVDGRR